MIDLREYMINESSSISLDDIPSYSITDGVYNGKKVMVIGKPFTSDHDESYHIATNIIEQEGLKLINSMEAVYKEMGEKAEDIEEWSIVCSLGSKDAQIVPTDNIEIKI